MKSGIILALVLILAACARAGSAPTPQASSPATVESSAPASPPIPSGSPGGESTPEGPLSPQSIEGLDVVINARGYVLVPTYIPQGFQAARASLSGGEARITFTNTQGRLIITYPVEFSPEDTSIMREIGLLRPSDALAEVKIDGQTAYLMRGGWSDATILRGPSIDPSQAKWEYDKSLTLLFDYSMPDGSKIGVAVQALPRPSAWTSDAELVRIAESLTLSD